jgi:hypothetical protein
MLASFLWPNPPCCTRSSSDVAIQQEVKGVYTLILASERSNIATGNALFHLLASLFSLDVHSANACRKDIPADEIRQLRAEGHSVAEIARRTGATVSEVRRIVGKLDPAEKERRRKEQEATAARINARSEPWPEKVRRWKAETGQSEATLFRIIKRSKGRHPEVRPRA